MITELGIGNFKAFAETQRMPIRPLTLIFGANSSGKSSIIQSLLLAHHGMATGDFDVHQPKLAGEMVDLGGFRSYVHKRDPSRPVTLHLETAINTEALIEHLDGEPEEKVPFYQVSRFGLDLSLTSRERTLEKVEVSVGGEQMLTFSRTGRDRYSATIAAGSQAFLRALINYTMGFSLVAQSRRKAPVEVDETLSLHDSSPKMSREQRGVETIKEILELVGGSQTLNQTDVAHFHEIFANIMAEDPFSFDKFVLRDPGQEDFRRWPSRSGQLAEGNSGGLLDCFQEIASLYSLESSELARKIDLRLKERGRETNPGHFDPKPLWWAEAQAVRHNLSNLIAFGTTRFWEVLAGIAYLGPLRHVPARHSTMHRGDDPEFLAGGGLAWELACQNAGVVETVNRWLGPGRLGTPYRIKRRLLLDSDRVREAFEKEADALRKLNENADLTELAFEDIQSKTLMSHRDIGFGIGQVLPVLVSAGALNERLAAIEQPELHLHPAQQAELGDVFIESALGERKNTFLLETHSEHLILRILRRVRETTEGTLPKGCPPIRPEDVSVVSVQPGANGAQLLAMPVTPDGDFACPWPGGFFAERFQELP